MKTPQAPAPDSAEEMAALNIPIEKSIHEQAKRAARKRGLSLAGLVRLLLTDEIARLGLDKEGS